MERTQWLWNANSRLNKLRGHLPSSPAGDIRSLWEVTSCHDTRARGGIWCIWVLIYNWMCRFELFSVGLSLSNPLPVSISPEPEEPDVVGVSVYPSDNLVLPHNITLYNFSLSVAVARPCWACCPSNQTSQGYKSRTWIANKNFVSFGD